MSQDNKKDDQLEKIILITGAIGLIKELIELVIKILELLSAN